VSGSRAKKILVRTLTGGALVAVVAALFGWAERSASDLPVAIVATALATMSAIELARMGSLRRYELRYALPLVALASFALARDRSLWAGLGGLGGDGRAAVLVHVVSIGVAAFAVRVIFGIVVRRTSGPGTLRAGLVAALGGLWVVVPLALLVEVWRQFGVRGTIAFVVLSKVGDITGYFVGNACGRHHPFPNLSPGKTTEGCLGSLVGGVLVGGWLGSAGLIAGGLVAGALAGGVLNLAGQAGDLLESKVKRTTGVKDSSAWLGASGGFLDVLDSLFLTVPTALVLWPRGF